MAGNTNKSTPDRPLAVEWRPPDWETVKAVFSGTPGIDGVDTKDYNPGFFQRIADSVQNMLTGTLTDSQIDYIARQSTFGSGPGLTANQNAENMAFVQRFAQEQRSQTIRQDIADLTGLDADVPDFRQFALLVGLVLGAYLAWQMVKE